MGYNARVCRFLAGTPPSSPASPSVRGRKAQDPAGGIWRSSEPKAYPAPCGAGRKRRGKVRAGSDVRPAPGKPRDDRILKLVGFTGRACVNGGDVGTRAGWGHVHADLLTLYLWPLLPKTEGAGSPLSPAPLPASPLTFRLLFSRLSFRQRRWRGRFQRWLLTKAIRVPKPSSASSAEARRPPRRGPLLPKLSDSPVAGKHGEFCCDKGPLGHQHLPGPARG